MTMAYQIISRSEWGARPPLKPFDLMTQPEGWVVHYVGDDINPDPTDDQSRAMMRQLQAEAQSPARGYSDFPYNFGLDPNGRIYEGRGWAYKNGANGTTSSNSHLWAVCCLAGPDTPMKQAEKDALLWLIQEGAKRNGAVSYVLPHRGVPGVSTACPGDIRAGYVPFLNQHMHDPELPPDLPQVEEDDMIVYAPARLQRDPNRPAFAWLDRANKRVWVEGGPANARFKEPHFVGNNHETVYGVPANTDLIGIGSPNADLETVVVTAHSFDGSGAPAFSYHWA